MNEKTFFGLLNECRNVFRNTIPNFEERGTDFDSMIYANGIKSDLKTVEKYLPFKSERILDVGCGKGHISVMLSSMGYNVTGVEILDIVGEFQAVSKSGWQLNVWKELSKKYQVQYGLSDSRKLPFKNNCFDAVVAYAVIEHIPESGLNDALNEICRVIKNDGKLFIFKCPRSQSYAEWMASIFKMPGHDRLIKEEEMYRLLEYHGFSIIYFDRTDMIIGFLPSKLQKLWNFMSPVLSVIDSILLKTPFSYFAHHLAIVARKITLSDETGKHNE